MTTIDEKEILEIEKLKADFRKVLQDLDSDKVRLDHEQKRLDLEMKKTNYEACKLSFYGVAVGAGATFAIAKTLQLLG